MAAPEIIPHLFRTEYQKLTAVLCSNLGLNRLDLAEDIASDTFLLAAETWSFKGLPANPVAWLYHVARNKAIDQLRREQLFARKVAPQVTTQTSQTEEPLFDFSDDCILDSQLKMMFAVCHPVIPAESQVALALRVLCGFGIDEIATAFLTSKETINKRLFRAREKMREQQISMDIPIAAVLHERLESVLTCLYLLFNEGYYSQTGNQVIRKDLCLEAIRLTFLLTQYKPANLPRVNALLALFCFQSSRLDARISPEGSTIPYEQQDSTLWNQQLIRKGNYYLTQAATGDRASRYHYEAAIAYWHTQPGQSTDKWQHILRLYNDLMLLTDSPVAALNRVYAVFQVWGADKAIEEALRLQLEGQQIYHALLGTLYEHVDRKLAIQHLTIAIDLTRNQPDNAVLQERLMRLKRG